MASTSNAITQCTSSSSFEYDVFVSFRGEDTRNSFTGFLFQALEKQGIEAFKDDKDIRKGESIAPELIRAIEGSHVFVVVFSKDYASSTWCLRELAHIWNCIETSPRHVLPIFYDVDPSQVRKQSGDYEKAFAQHEQSFRFEKNEVKRWREVLERVADLAGWDIKNKQQHGEIEDIVQQIKNILGSKFSTLPYDNLVGMESHFAELSKLICLGPINDVQFVGITGMGGIGKSTLGRALYERNSHQFNSCCYIDDVSKLYQGYGGALEVQKQLLSQCLNERNLEICNVSDGTALIWKRLSNAKALIVFDNVDQHKQLDMFTGGRVDLLRKCLGRGSIIIIISRDQQILKAHKVNVLYQVEPLNDKDAVQLFCKKAFNSNYIMSDFDKLTCDVLSHCQGHPLAIEVLGSSLFDKDVSHWRSALASLRENKSIMNVLRISFDQLEDTHKEIFLDIACFFNWESANYVTKVLNFRGFNPEYGLQVLVDKSLISVFSHITMHDLLRDLGKRIVRENSPKKPWKWSRLWDFKDFSKVMSNNKAAENVEAIVIQMDNHCGTTMRVDGLSTMSNLKLLILGRSYRYNILNFSGTLNLSNELGYLRWTNYPFECLPPSFEPDKLVELILPHSNIKQLWEDTKSLPNLRLLDLSDSKNLIKVPYIGDALHLESLHLEGCTQLEEIGLSIVLSRKLTFLILKDCKSLIKLPQFGEDLILEHLNLEGCQKLRQIDPSIGLLKRLTYLNLKDCKSLIKLPQFGEDLILKDLNLEGCQKLRQIGPSIGLLKRLTHLNLKDCKSLIKLPQFGEDLSLFDLNLEGCQKLRQIDPSIGRLKMLTYLNLKNCKNLVSLPNSILGLNSLCQLNLSGCSKLYNTESLYEQRDAEHLKKIDIDGAPIHFQSTSSYFREHKISVGCLMPASPIFPNMLELDLSFCNLVQIPDAIGNICCLEWLDLSGNSFATLPNLKKLSYLLCLKLQHCKQLKSLPELPLPARINHYYISRKAAPKWLSHGGLYIFNCPELVDRKGCTDMVFSWMMRLSQYQYISIYHNRGSVTPGSEIPSWFNNQHEGNCVNVDASPVMHDDNWIGIAFCAIFVVPHQTLSAMAFSEAERRYLGFGDIPVDFYGDVDLELVLDKSDHMWLFFVKRKAFIQQCHLQPKYLGKKYPEVKKYGYRWVYKDDIEQLIKSVGSEAQTWGN